MGGLSRITLWLLGGLIALAAIALLMVNLYVQSQGTQARIQQELSHRLGTPIHIRAISVTPWGGLTLSGISIPQASGPVADQFLEAKSFHLHVRLWSLFFHRLVIKQVSLLGPSVVWPQNEDGKWRLPGSHAEGSAADADESVPAPPAPDSTVTGPPQPTSSVAVVSPKTQPAATDNRPAEVDRIEHSFVPEVRRVNVSDGNFRFLDQRGNMVAAFEGLRFNSNVRNSQALRGSARIAKISLRDRFFLQDLQSPLHYDPDALDLPNISARSGGGEVNGQFTMQPQSEDSPFHASVKFRNVQADEIVTEAGGPKGVIRGKLEGSFEATGKTADANALTGQGEIFLRDGQLQQYSLLVALGQVLQIEELTQLQLQQAEARYHVTPGVVTVDQLILRSPNIRLSATGTVSFNGKMRLESQLAINDKIRSQLFSPIRDNFQTIDEPGYSAVNFQVTGTIDRPKTNLMEKVVGRNLKDFVSGILGGGKSDRPKKKRPRDADAVSPSATPAEESPAPAAPSSTPP